MHSYYPLLIVGYPQPDREEEFPRSLVIETKIAIGDVEDGPSVMLLLHKIMHNPLCGT